MRLDDNESSDTYICKGSCHCGRVRFAVRVPQNITVQNCNCSICTKTGFVHLLVQRKNFEILTGEQELAEYRFNTGIARHFFCTNCSVKAFYVPRSHPQGYSVNLNCVVLNKAISVIHEDFNGQNWAQNIGRLKDHH